MVPKKSAEESFLFQSARFAFFWPACDAFLNRHSVNSLNSVEQKRASWSVNTAHYYGFQMIKHRNATRRPQTQGNRYFGHPRSSMAPASPDNRTGIGFLRSTCWKASPKHSALTLPSRCKATCTSTCTIPSETRAIVNSPAILKALRRLCGITALFGHAYIRMDETLSRRQSSTCCKRPRYWSWKVNFVATKSGDGYRTVFKDSSTPLAGNGGNVPARRASLRENSHHISAVTRRPPAHSDGPLKSIRSSAAQVRPRPRQPPRLGPPSPFR